MCREHLQWLALRLGAPAAALVLAACGAHQPAYFEDLDPVTGVTVARAASPLTFYRDNSGHAAYARDYVNLGPVDVNRMGEHRYFLWLCIWSTLPEARPTAQRDGFESVIVFADGEPLPLNLLGWTPAAIGASETGYAKPVASAAEAYYEVTLDQIRVLAGARDLRLQLDAARPAAYELWDRQSGARADLQAFLDRARF